MGTIDDATFRFAMSCLDLGLRFRYDRVEMREKCDKTWGVDPVCLRLSTGIEQSCRERALAGFLLSTCESGGGRSHFLNVCLGPLKRFNPQAIVLSTARQSVGCKVGCR